MKRNLDRQAKTARIMKQLGTFQKESHAKSLAEGIIRSCGDEKSLTERVKKAKEVAKSMRDAGVSSFFSAEYAKVFTSPKAALSTRRRLIREFKKDHELTDKRAAKMADCIVFAAAKKQDPTAVDYLAALCSESLNAEIPFNVVADVVYYNAADVAPEKFANRCVSTSIKQKAPLSVSEIELASRLSVAIAA